LRRIWTGDHFYKFELAVNDSNFVLR